MMLTFSSIFAFGWLLWIGYRSYRRAQAYHACEVCADRGVPEQQAHAVHQGRWMCPSCVNDAIHAEKKKDLVQVTVKRKAA